MKILLATKNPGKIREMNWLFRDTNIEFIGLEILKEVPDVVEDGKTYHENALKKAMTFFKLASIPTLAEDLGLEVEYLKGAPGILSARFAGEGATPQENNQKLLNLLTGVPEEKRNARFIAVLCLVIDGNPYFFEGEIQGRILDRPRGESGFGYDPIFVPDGYDRSFAELGADIKNQISHRARDRKSTRLNSSHTDISRMPSSS